MGDPLRKAARNVQTGEVRDLVSNDDGKTWQLDATSQADMALDSGIKAAGPEDRGPAVQPPAPAQDGVSAPDTWPAERAAKKAKLLPPPEPELPSRYDPPAEPASLGGFMRSIPDVYYDPATGPDPARQKQVFAQAEKEHQTIARADALTGPQWVAGQVLPYLAAGTQALSRIRTLGAADRLVGNKTHAEGGRMAEASQNLSDAATQGVDMPGLRPINVPFLGPVVPVAALSALFGGGGKGSAMNGVGKVAGAVTRKIPGVAGAAVAGGVAGGLASGGTSAVDAAANAATGQPQENDQLKSAGLSALMGIPFGMVMHGTQKLAAKVPQALREGKRGADLVTAENGGVQTAMFGPGGLKPTPEMRAAQAQQGETGQPAQNISKQTAGEAILPMVEQRREAGIARSAGEQKAYEASPAGHETVSAQPVIDKMFDIKQRLTSSRQLSNGTTLEEPLAWTDFSPIQKQLKRLVHAEVVSSPEEGAKLGYQVVPVKDAREMGIDIYNKKVGQKPPPPALEDKIMAPVPEAAGPKPKKTRYAMLVPAQLSPADLEETVRGISDAAKEHQANKTPGLRHLTEMSAAVHALRDDFLPTGPNGPAPETLTSTTKDGKKQLSGYSAMKAEQGKRASADENVLRTIGLSKDLKSLDPNQHDQLTAVTNSLSSRRMTPDEMRALVGDNKQVEKLLRTALAHQSFDKLIAGSGVHGSVYEAGHGLRGVVSGSMPDPFRIDPMMRHIGNFKEPPAARENAVASRAAHGTTVLMQNLIDLRDAFKPKRQEQGANP